MFAWQLLKKYGAINWCNPNRYTIDRLLKVIQIKEEMSKIRGVMRLHEIVRFFWKTKNLPCAGELGQPSGWRENDKPNMDVAENGQLPRFLKQAPSSLGEGHLSRLPLLYLLDLYFLPRHYRSALLFLLFGRRESDTESAWWSKLADEI